MKPRYCLLLFLVMLPACRKHAPFDWPRPLPLGRDLPSYVPPPGHEATPDVDAGPAFDEPATLSLRDAMAAALLSNPELRTFAWEVRATEARALQAGLPPNPEAGVELENVGGNGGVRVLNGSETTLSISQLLLVGGKLEKRIRLASLDRDLSAFDYETARVDVLTMVATRFVRLLAAQKRVELAAQAHDLATGVFEVVSKRVQAGDLSPVERTRSRVNVSTARLALEQARRTRRAGRIRLASLWGNTRPTFETAEGDLDRVPATIPSADALAELVSNNPDVARWAVEMSKRRAALAEARADAVPDVTVQGGVRHFNDGDDTAFVVGLTLPLPLFDRNQGRRLEARTNIHKTHEAHRAALTRVRTALGDGYEMLGSSHAAVTTLRDEILPDANSAIEATRKAFQEGKLGHLDILDAQRTLVQLEAEYLDALTTFHVSVAAVERLIAQPLEDVSSSAPQGARP